MVTIVIAAILSIIRTDGLCDILLSTIHQVIVHHGKYLILFFCIFRLEICRILRFISPCGYPRSVVVSATYILIVFGLNIICEVAKYALEIVRFSVTGNNWLYVMRSSKVILRESLRSSLIACTFFTEDSRPKRCRLVMVIPYPRKRIHSAALKLTSNKSKVYGSNRSIQTILSVVRKSRTFIVELFHYVNIS